MESLVVTVLDIGKTLIPFRWMLRIVHAQDVHNHLIEDLSLAIGLGVESNGFCELGVQKRPDDLKMKEDLKNLNDYCK